MAAPNTRELPLLGRGSAPPEYTLLFRGLRTPLLLLFELCVIALKGRIYLSLTHFRSVSLPT